MTRSNSCTSRGYQFVPERDGAQVQYAGLVPIFGDIGYTRSWRSEISGTFEGRRFVAFEYMYAIGGGTHSGGVLSRHAVVKWDLPGAGLPNYNVCPPISSSSHQLLARRRRPR